MPAWGFEKVRRCIFPDRRVEVVLVLLFLFVAERISVQVMSVVFFCSGSCHAFDERNVASSS
jgi:hypothetical protein